VALTVIEFQPGFLLWPGMILDDQQVGKVGA
jgi:hypothetical protein